MVHVCRMNPTRTAEQPDLKSLSQTLQDIAADVREAIAQVRDLQTQLSNLARSVLDAVSELERMRS